MISNKTSNWTFYGSDAKQYRDHWCKGCDKEIEKGKAIIRVTKQNPWNIRFVGYVCSENCFKKLR